MTIDGDAAPVTWIGYRHVLRSSHPNPECICPVRVKAHALGPGAPQADLLLSPDHAIFVENVLIPIRYLINGQNIRQEWPESITYFHVELPRHSVIYAEGLPAESYLDTGDRSSFANSPAPRIHPYFGSPVNDRSLVMDALGYAPLHITGEKVDRTRVLLSTQMALAGPILSPDGLKRIGGFVA